MKLEFQIPGKDEPGFLRRQRQALEFQNKLTSNPGIDTFDDLLEWLAQFVKDPSEHQEKLDALMDASENQILALLEAIGGGGKDNPK